MTGAVEKQQAHELIDRFPPEQLPAVVGMLQFLLLDPVARAAAAAPADDEEITQEDRRRLHGDDKSAAMENVLADFGLKPEDFPR